MTRLPSIPLAMAVCLSLTLVFELLAAFGAGIRKGKDFVNVILVNVMTNPIVATVPLWVNLRFGITPRHIVLAFLEVFALFSEAFVYAKVLDYKRMHPLLLSLLLNLCSYGAGIILNPVIYG